MPCQSITEATSNENQNTNRDKRLHFLKMSGIYNNPFSALIFTTMSLKCHKLMMKTIIWWLGGQAGLCGGLDLSRGAAARQIKTITKRLLLFSSSAILDIPFNDTSFDSSRVSVCFLVSITC